MSRWFRHYAGMMRDEKLVSAAVRSKQPVERVVWVWGAILESAAEINDGGRFEFDAGEAAYFLRCDEGELDGVIAALDALGRVSQGAVVRWDDRQFNSDQSKDRQKRYRDRQKASRNDNSDVTQPSRDGEVTPQDTETDTDISEANASSCPEPEKSAPVVVSPTAIELPCVSGDPFPITEADVTEWREAFPAVDIRQQLAAMRSWLNANPTRRKTRKGMRRFVVSWLDRKQNSGQAPPASRSGAAPPGKRMNAVEALVSLRSREIEHEQTGPIIDHGNAELVRPDDPKLRGFLGDLGTSMRWPVGSGNH